MHRPHRLGTAFPRLHDSREAEALAASLLQPDPSRRVSAQDALHHNYFASLPRRLYDLPDGKKNYFQSMILIFFDNATIFYLIYFQKCQYLVLMVCSYTLNSVMQASNELCILRLNFHALIIINMCHELVWCLNFFV